MRDSGQSVAPAHVNVAPAPSSVESNVHGSSVKKYGILDMCVERKQLSWKWVKRQVALCESHGSTPSLECAAQSCKSRNQTFSVEQRQVPNRHSGTTAKFWALTDKSNNSFTFHSQREHMPFVHDTFLPRRHQEFQRLI